MMYFSEPASVIYLRDVSKTLSNHVFKKKNQQAEHKLKVMKYSNEIVAREMRATIGSILTMVDIILLALGTPD